MENAPSPFAETPDDALIAASNKLMALELSCLEGAAFLHAASVHSQRRLVDAELRRRGLLPAQSEGASK